MPGKRAKRARTWVRWAWLSPRGKLRGTSENKRWAYVGAMRLPGEAVVRVRIVELPRRGGGGK